MGSTYVNMAASSSPHTHTADDAQQAVALPHGGLEAARRLVQEHRPRLHLRGRSGGGGGGGQCRCDSRKGGGISGIVVEMGAGVAWGRLGGLGSLCTLLDSALASGWGVAGCRSLR